MASSSEFYSRGITHDGTFHADDVFATALLRQLNPDFEVERMGYPLPENISDDVVVYDIGGGKFDHHQPGAPVRDDGTPYAAFGLLWNEFGSELLHEEDAADFEERFIKPIDYGDNTGNINEMARIISDFNTAGTDRVAQDAAFEGAVDFAGGILERRFEKYREMRVHLEAAREVVAEQEGSRVVSFDEWNPAWKQAVLGTDVEYITYPSDRGGFNVQGAPVTLDTGDVVTPLPEAWRGLRGEELESVSGIEGLTFCHASGFLAAATDEKTAQVAAERALEIADAAKKDKQMLDGIGFGVDGASNQSDLHFGLVD